MSPVVAGAALAQYSTSSEVSLNPPNTGRACYLKYYYTHHFDDALHTVKRTFPFAILLLAFRFYWRICLLDSTSDTTSASSTQSQILSISRISLLSKAASSDSRVQISILAINSFVILLLILHFLAHSQKLTKRYKRIFTFIQFSLSALFQTYAHAFFIPATFHSINAISMNDAQQPNNIIAMIALATTILIEILVLAHDQNWSFASQDVLDRRNDLEWDIGVLFLEVTSTFILSISPEKEGVFLIGIVLSAFSLLSIHKNLPYSLRTIRILDTAANIFCCLFSFIQLGCSIAVGVDSTQASILIIGTEANNYFVFMVGIMLIPLSVRSASVFLRAFQPSFDLEYLERITSLDEYDHRVDALIRELVCCSNQLEFEVYTQWKYSHVVEAIILSHYSTCKRYPNCFCSLEIKGNEKSRDLMVEGKERLKYIVDFIEDTFNRIIANRSRRHHHLNQVSSSQQQKESQQNLALQGTSTSSQSSSSTGRYLNMGQNISFDIFYTFFYFLFEKKQSKILAFSEIVRMLGHSMHSLHHRRSGFLGLRAEFFFTRILKEVRIAFAKSTLQASLSQYDHDQVRSKNLMLGIQFDEKLNRFQHLFSEGLKEKLSFLSIVSSDFFELANFERAASLYKHTRSRLEEKLHELFRMNANSQRLKYQLDSFLQLMSFVMKKNEFLGISSHRSIYSLGAHAAAAARLKNRNQRNKQNNNNNKQLKYQNGQIPNKSEEFSGDSEVCIIFISLLGKHGVIKRAQNSFMGFFGYTQDEAIGKNIEFLMPDLVGQYHDNIVRDYFYDKKQLNEYSDNDEATIPLSLARNQAGWAVPIQLRLKTECFAMECGICAEISLVRGDFAFVMTAGKSFMHQISSEVFFVNVLSNYFSKSDLNKLNLINVIPALPTVVAKQAQNPFEWQKTIAVLPKDLSSVATATTPNSQFSPVLNKSLHVSNGIPNSVNLNDVEAQRERVKQKNTAMFLENVAGKSKFLSRIDNANTLMRYCDIFEVCLKVYANQNSYFKYNILQIISFQRITDPMEIHHEFHSFKQEYEKNLSFSEEIVTDDYQHNTIGTFRGSEMLNSHVNGIDLVSPLSRNGGGISLSVIGGTQAGTTAAAAGVTGSNGVMGTSRTAASGAATPNLTATTPMTQAVTTPRAKKTRALSAEFAKIAPRLQNRKVSENYYCNFDRTNSLESKRNLDNNNNNIQSTNNNINNNNNNVQMNETFQSMEEVEPTALNTCTIRNTQQEFLFSQNDINVQLSTQRAGRQSSRSLLQSSNIPSDNNLYHNQLPPTNNNNSKSSTPLSPRLQSSDQLQQQSQSPGTTDRKSQFQSQFSKFQLDRKRSSNTSSSPGNQLISEVDEDNYYNNKSNHFNHNHSPIRTQKKQSFSQHQSKQHQQQLPQTKQQQKPTGQIFRHLSQSNGHSHNTRSYERKRVIKEHILQPKSTGFLQILTGFGVISLVSILTVTLFQFISVSKNLNVISLCSQFIPWPMNVRTELVSMLKQEGLLRLSQSGVFPSIDSMEFRDSQTLIGEKSARNLLDLYYSFMTADLEKLEFLDFANTDRITFYQTKDEQVISNRSASSIATKYASNFTLTYVIPYYAVVYSEMPRKKSDELIYTMMTLDNFPLLNPRLLVIQEQIHELSVEKHNFIMSETTILLFLVICVMLAFIGSIFPIYIYLQTQKEQVYRLFATIQNTHLKNMLAPVVAYLNEDKHTKTTSILDHHLKKKKAIAETSRLIKFKPSMLLYCLFAFVTIIIQPITNSVLTSQFQAQSIASMDLLRNIYGLKALFMSNLGLYYEYMYHVMMPNALFYFEEYFDNRFPQLAKQSEYQVQEMYQFVTNARSSAKFEKTLFDSFLFKILEGNMCEAIAEHPEYVTAENEFDYNECLSINQGQLKNGMQINVKSFIAEFSDLLAIFYMNANATTTTTSSSSSEDARVAKLLEWESELNLKEFDDYTKMLFKVFGIMKDFMLTILEQQMSEMKLIQNLLVSFQIIALILVFFQGWLRFYLQIEREMLEARQLLSILSIDVIIENSYIQSYIAN